MLIIESNNNLIKHQKKTYKIVNEAYAEFFKGVEFPPARALIGVAALPKSSLVEIECIALADSA